MTITLSGRARGCLLGGAVGDALGSPVEFVYSVREIRERFGPDGVTTLEPGYHGLGTITDDTQMSMFTAEGLIQAHLRRLEHGTADVRAIVWEAYRRWISTQGPGVDVRADGWLLGLPELHARRAPGNTCEAAMHGGVPGSRTNIINDSKGCGGVMRVAPVGLIAEDAYEVGCDLAALTHTHPTGWVTAGVLAVIVRALFHGAAMPIAVRAGLHVARAADLEGLETATALERAIVLADEGPVPSPQTVEQLGQGWVAEEALAMGVYCALVARDFRHGVLLAVNHGGDSDSTGSIAGNLLGTALGERGIPTAWLDTIELRAALTQLADDLLAVQTFARDTVPPAFAERYPAR